MYIVFQVSTPIITIFSCHMQCTKEENCLGRELMIIIPPKLGSITNRVKFSMKCKPVHVHCIHVASRPRPLQEEPPYSWDQSSPSSLPGRPLFCTTHVLFAQPTPAASPIELPWQRAARVNKAGWLGGEVGEGEWAGRLNVYVSRPRLTTVEEGGLFFSFFLNNIFLFSFPWVPTAPTSLFEPSQQSPR